LTHTHDGYLLSRIGDSTNREKQVRAEIEIGEPTEIIIGSLGMSWEMLAFFSNSPNNVGYFLGTFFLNLKRFVKIQNFKWAVAAQRLLADDWFGGYSSTLYPSGVA
jgi:hypothetical protein